MFTLKAGSLDLNLEVVPVRSLLQHERTLEGTIKKLSLEFSNMAKLQNPIIIEENHLVLDGNHRAMVFKKLNYKHMPVCKIDYFNESVKLKYWYRIIKDFPDNGFLSRLFSDDEDYTVKTLASTNALNLQLDESPLSFGVIHGDYRAIIEFNDSKVKDAVDAYDALERLQDKIKSVGFSMDYIPCQFLEKKDYISSLTKTDLIILTPHITKEMVISAAKKHKIFAPKTTRHIIPARPINVNVPVRWCNELISREELDSRFTHYLRGKNVLRFGPGQVIDGRYYSEEIFVFVDKK
ncbi:MAG: hypothetical protein ACTSVI_00590 [Promethearchaeota archaeon]